MKIKIYCFLLISIIASPFVKAQFNFYAGYQGIYDDNIFNNYLMISDYINNFSAGTAYNFESDFNNIQIYYEGSLNTFRKNTSKSFNAHRIGFVETHLFSIDDNPLNAGVNYSFRNNEDDFKVYDFNQLSTYINYKHSISETDFIIAGYIYNRNNYKNFSRFSHHEHRAFLSWISSFETGTSIFLNAEYNFKKYFETYELDSFLNEASYFKMMTNVSQSLNEQTGINGYVVYRKNLSEGSRYLLSDSLIYYEEEIFNDIYSYSGVETGVGFKHYFGDYVEFSAEAKYLIKNYSSLNAVAVDGNELSELREDKLWGVGAGLAFDLSGLVSGFSLSVSYNYLKNQSNDYYYNYTNQMISASLDYDL